ncbi:hypothetical protein ACFQDH_20320 [Flexivirga alba]|uniref:Uncharacterized protein n=1 Tax=Flexivirga alba TaxID=702742 RepID=A0ABW2AL24_9MICO
MHRGLHRRARIAARPTSGQPEESGQRELHRLLDRLPHLVGERTGVAGHPVDHCTDDPFADGGEHFGQRRDDRLGDLESGSNWHGLFAAHKSSMPPHAQRARN